MSGDNGRKGQTPKLQFVGVYPDALYRKKINATLTIREKGSTSKKHLLRVSKVHSGASMVAEAKEITQCLKPMLFLRIMRTAKVVLDELLNTLLFAY